MIARVGWICRAGRAAHRSRGFTARRGALSGKGARLRLERLITMHLEQEDNRCSP
jgi:hypothetical protein